MTEVIQGNDRSYLDSNGKFAAGNPGRPRTGQSITERIREMLHNTFSEVLAVSDAPDLPMRDVLAATAIVRAKRSDGPMAYLIDRLDGKAVQATVNVTVTGGWLQALGGTLPDVSDSIQQLSTPAADPDASTTLSDGS